MTGQESRKNLKIKTIKNPKEITEQRRKETRIKDWKDEVSKESEEWSKRQK